MKFDVYYSPAEIEALLATPGCDDQTLRQDLLLVGGRFRLKDDVFTLARAKLMDEIQRVFNAIHQLEP